MKTKLKFCPFCGHHGQKLVSSQHTGLHKEDEGSPAERVVRTIWQVKCECCGAVGPVEYEPRFAVDSWNFNHTEPAHDDDPPEIDFEYEDLTESEI